MNITLIGYGKMGREIERLATERGYAVIGRVEPGVNLTPDEIQRTDVAIHFANAESVLPSVGQWATAKKPIIVGTTGWQKDMSKVELLVKEKNTGLVHAPNFSIGVNIFLRLVKDAGRLMNKFSEYDVAVHEIHHKDKVDSPSGTALAVAKTLLDQIQRKKTLLPGSPQGTISPDQLQVTSARTGAVVGTHTVTFDSTADAIVMTHDAKNRSGFAQGALLAAEWIRDRKGFYSMEDVLADFIR